MDVLQNKWLRIEASENGAELCSVQGQKTGQEYMWCGDPQYWGRHSPLLFPLVGRLKDHRTSLWGHPFMLPKHGIVSNEVFERVELSHRHVTYRLESNERMHRQFPCPFRIDVSYRLRANYVHVIWTILNTGIRELPYHIGGHPGINYPNFNPDEEIKGYLSFRRSGPIESASVCETGCLGPNRYPLALDEEEMLPITDECFRNDAIIIDKSQVNHVALLDQNREPYVSIDTTAPVTLIWSPYGVKAPFVCLEPWYGLCDSQDYEGDFRSRPYTSYLAPGHSAIKGYILRFDAEGR